MEPKNKEILKMASASMMQQVHQEFRITVIHMKSAQVSGTKYNYTKSKQHLSNHLK
jgi:hypothetical protein